MSTSVLKAWMHDLELYRLLGVPLQSGSPRCHFSDRDGFPKNGRCGIFTSIVAFNFQYINILNVLYKINSD